jgi:hypothetical protein
MSDSTSNINVQPAAGMWFVDMEEKTCTCWHRDYILAGNPDTMEHVLVELARHTVPMVRGRVAENVHTPLGTLIKLALDEDVEVRVALSHNAKLPPPLMWYLCTDPSNDVRYSMAENPHFSAEVLQHLAEDANPYVAFRARRTLDTLAIAGPGIVLEPMWRTAQLRIAK